MTRGVEQRGGIAERLVRAGAEILTPSPDSRSIWQRYPELTKIPKDRFPQNVFIIPDGNGRWAALKGLADQMGHEKGAEVIVQAFRDLGELSEFIPYVGAWGLSVDNLKRPKKEVDYLMGLFDRLAKRLLPELMQRNSRFIHLGRKDIFDSYPFLRETIDGVEEKTRNNTGQVTYIAAGFGGDDQDVRIDQEIIRMVIEGKITSPKDATSQLRGSLRDGGGLISSADLVIRTSGEQRLSGLGWIAEGSELYFSKTLFPAFATKDFVKALVDYSKRDRRFGGRPARE